MKAFLQKEGILWFSHGDLGADLSWILAVTFTILFMIAWYQARKAKGNPHHTIILWAMLAMIGYFVLYYLARQLGALSFTGGAEGQEGFGGSEFIYNWVFSPLLTIHIIIVSIGLVLGIYMIPLGFRTSKVISGRRVLIPGDPKGSAKVFSRNTLIIAFVLGLLLPILRGFMTGHSVRLFVDWLIVCVVIGALVVLIERVGARYYPDGEGRHRALGTFTMVFYVAALVTSTLTYFMLYVIWPPKVIG